MVAETKFYKILDVNPDASPAQLKAAYRRLALKFHPDKNSSSPEAAAEKFKELKYAYEVLSDPQKGKYYNILGEDGIKQGG
ncbi:dnaJ-like protein subfamily B member 6-A-like protein, partial [Aureobasidium namibiae CBS 147.97]